MNKIVNQPNPSCSDVVVVEDDILVVVAGGAVVFAVVVVPNFKLKKNIITSSLDNSHLTFCIHL